MNGKRNDFCVQCCNPKDLGVINPATGKHLNFFDTENGTICEICHEMETLKSLPTRQYFDQELDLFLKSNKKILFAYSGGLDSTVVLSLLSKECQQREIELQIFTVETSAKGKMTHENIKNVLEFLNLQKNHFYVDVTNLVQNNPKILAVTGTPMTTMNVYKECRKKGVLPCGKICNAMIDGAYDDVMKKLGYSQMVTGGDTPKKNSKGVYSLFWTKPSGITIIRGGYAYSLTKSGNAKYIKDHNIPWVNPQCGGYDTDCLVPGVFFAEGLNHNPKQKMETVIEKYPIILDYVTERTRFGTIDYQDALKMMTDIDISSEQSYSELISIFNSWAKA
jgi:hypothetical protein